MHHGISSRDFTRSFTLAEYVEVNDAVIENGILTVSLERIVPETMKPKAISITHKK
jgi:molecular chaperone IbpA